MGWNCPSSFVVNKITWVLRRFNVLERGGWKGGITALLRRGALVERVVDHVVASWGLVAVYRAVLKFVWTCTTRFRLTLVMMLRRREITGSIVYDISRKTTDLACSVLVIGRLLRFLFAAVVIISAVLLVIEVAPEIIIRQLWVKKIIAFHRACVSKLRRIIATS